MQLSNKLTYLRIHSYLLCNIILSNLIKYFSVHDLASEAAVACIAVISFDFPPMSPFQALLSIRTTLFCPRFL
jgi:hypothetical protein